MFSDSVGADYELFTNLIIAQALDNQGQHLFFTLTSL
jgi:hypothetical protein